MTDGLFMSPVPAADPVALAAQELAYARLATSARRLVDACVRTRQPIAELAEITQGIETLTARLEEVAQPGPLGLEVSSDGRLRDWANPVIGARNPIAPPLVIDKDRATGRTSTRFVLGAAYEGPPGHVHGGIVALILDQVLGTVPAVIGHPGMTAYLNLTYVRPTPLGPLSAQAWVERVEGWKVLVRGHLADAEDRPTVEAEGLFVVPRWARDRLSPPAGDAGDFDPPSTAQPA